MIDPQAIEQLEADIRAMEWERVSFEPDAAEVQQLDQELPQEWAQILPPEQERAYTPDELNDLLHSDLDIPEGDIDANVRQALNELEIDTTAIAQERDLDLDFDPPQQQDLDFDR